MRQCTSRVASGLAASLMNRQTIPLRTGWHAMFRQTWGCAPAHAASPHLASQFSESHFLPMHYIFSFQKAFRVLVLHSRHLQPSSGLLCIAGPCRALAPTGLMLHVLVKHSIRLPAGPCRLLLLANHCHYSCLHSAPPSTAFLFANSCLSYVWGCFTMVCCVPLFSSAGICGLLAGQKLIVREGVGRSRC